MHRFGAVQEHSVMTAWPTERQAILNMIENFGDGLFACVMDSYDYVHALEKTLPAVRKQKVGKGGFMVLRPDSGDPVDCVVQAGLSLPLCYVKCIASRKELLALS
jgi:nicotinamide phosphoribosyltransferase